ncbi:MAG: SMC family ATPase [Chloroflexota bacterium]|nr:SMC family ATPase [Chloroflexota bacterium]
MIPVRLSVKNFLSYRDGAPTLDLEGVHVACLCGDNGHGKSALLDAITWALWGRSRVGVQEDLIYQGESEMRVELDFLAGGDLYRVSRRYARASRGRQGATILELHLLNGDAVQPISGSTMRETGRRIESLLRMTYDTFVNSAFILQGRANMFTTSTPKERKEVLGKVLDLSWYDQLSGRARRESREQENESLRLDARIEQIDREVSQKVEHELRLTEIEAQLEAVGREQTEREALAESLRDRLRELQDARADLDRLEAEADRAENETTTRGQRVEDARRQLEEAQGRAARLPALQAQESEASALVEQLSQPSPAMDEHAERIRGLQHAVQQMREAGVTMMEGILALEAKQRELELHEREESRIKAEIGRQEKLADDQVRRLEALRARADNLASLESEAVAVRNRVEELSAPSAEMGVLREQSQELQARVHYLREENGSLRREMEDLRAKKDMLEASAASEGGGATCPLCDSPLSEASCLHLAANYESHGKSLAEKFRGNEAEAHAAEVKRDTIERDLESLESSRRAELRSAQERLDSLTRDAADARSAADEADRLATARVVEDAALETNRLGLVETQAAMPRLRNEVGALADARARQEQNEAAIRESESERERLERELDTMARERREELADAQVRRDGLTRDLAEAGAAAGTLDRLAETHEYEAALLEDARSRLKELLDAMPALREASEGLPAAAEDYEAARSGLSEAVSRRDELRTHRTEEQAWLRRCRELEEERGTLRTARNEAANRQGAYDQLAAAFGRSGLQALLIEQAIPELENYANDVLGRVTEHRMSLKLETQRERRGGGDPRETLDIRISDELGTRSYETYSGGEAFRIDFALRIALSRLLAHRSGAPLPTLFIDEGFGSQDAAGLERLVEAIQAIQDDFQRILVITHIEELKDRFPVRIEVTKTLQGSTFSVS